MNAGNTGRRVQRATRSATARTPKPTGDVQRRRLGIRHQSHFAAGRGPSPAVRPAGLPPVAWRLRTRRSAAERRRLSALRRFCGEKTPGIGRLSRKCSASNSLQLQTGAHITPRRSGSQVPVCPAGPPAQGGRCDRVGRQPGKTGFHVGLAGRMSARRPRITPRRGPDAKDGLRWRTSSTACP